MCLYLLVLMAEAGLVANLRETRKRELLKSASILGLRSFRDITVVKDTCFLDSMTVR
jgi:hypothetical protein